MTRKLKLPGDGDPGPTWQHTFLLWPGSESESAADCRPWPIMMTPRVGRADSEGPFKSRNLTRGHCYATYDNLNQAASDSLADACYHSRLRPGSPGDIMI